MYTAVTSNEQYGFRPHNKAFYIHLSALRFQETFESKITPRYFAYFKSSTSELKSDDH